MRETYSQGWKKPKSRTVMPATVANPIKVTTPQHEPPDTTPPPLNDPAVPSKPKKVGLIGMLHDLCTSTASLNAALC